MELCRALHNAPVSEHTRLFVVLDDPAPLAGMAYPDEDTDWSAFRDAGFTKVLRLARADYDPSPLSAEMIELQDLAEGRLPDDPDSERTAVWRAARHVADSVGMGEGVIVHCVGGIGRTGTVLACALRLVGYSADDAVAAVKSHRPTWPESPWQEDVVRAG